MRRSSGADAGHKRRLENRLMMRRHDPVRVATAWSKSILPRRFRATRQYQGLDLTEARIGHAILASPFLLQARFATMTQLNTLIVRSSSALYRWHGIA